MKTVTTVKTRLVWLGLGAAALSSTLSAQATPGAQAAVSVSALEVATGRASGAPESQTLRVAENHSHATPVKADAGGEGGEGSAAKADTDASLDPAVRFYRDIQLVRGHLLVGDELVSAGRWADALPHFLHPVEELYDKLGPALKTRKMKPFLQQLKVLAQTVKAKNAAAYAGAKTALLAKLDAVDAGLKAQNKDWMPFAVETALETMRSAIGEYGASIEGGKFAKAVEYQDSRGFVWQAERLLSSVAAEMTAKDGEQAGRAKAELATLKTAWPDALPPAVAVMDAAQVAATISKIELALGRMK